MPTRILTEPARSARSLFAAELKRLIAACEHPRCPFATAPRNDFDAHEGLVAFGEMQGVIDKDVDLVLALSPANVFVLHHACHISNEPSKEECILMLKKRPKRIWEHYGLSSAKQAAAIFYGRLKELHEQGRFVVFPGLPKNLEILFK